MKRRVSRFDPDKIPAVPIVAEDVAMRGARRRLAEQVAAQEAADRRQPEPRDDDFERRLAAARAGVAPTEPVAYRFVPRQGGFVISAITEQDLAVSVSPRTPLRWPKV